VTATRPLSGSSSTPKSVWSFTVPPSLSDSGLLPIRELDDALGFTHYAADYHRVIRSGRNIRHHLVPLRRQSIYSRLAGYDHTNDAERLSQDPAMRVVVGWQASDRNAASTNTVSHFESETLNQKDNLQGLARMNPQWVEDAMAHTPHQPVILDMDSSESPVHGQQEGAAYNGDFECVCYHPSLPSISSVTVKVPSSVPGTSVAPTSGGAKC